MKKFLYIILLGLIISGCGKQDADLDVNDHFWLRNNKADMSVWVKGTLENKTIIVLLHGGPGASALDYRMPLFSGPLEEDYAVVYWDQRGGGTSQGAFSSEYLTIEQCVDDLHKLMILLKDKYGEDMSYFLYGHSWGGCLGTAYLLHDDYQNDFKGWIESDGAHNLPLLNKLMVEMFLEIGNRELDARKNTDKWKEIVDYCETIDPDAVTVEQSGMMNRYGHQAELLLDEVNESTMDPGFALRYLFFSPRTPGSWVTNTATNMSMLNEVEKQSYSDQMYTIEIPSLLLWGRYDFVTPPGLGQDAFDNLGGDYRKLVYFEHSGHSPMDKEPEEYVQEIKSFIEAFRN